MLTEHVIICVADEYTPYVLDAITLLHFVFFTLFYIRIIGRLLNSLLHICFICMNQHQQISNVLYIAISSITHVMVRNPTPKLPGLGIMFSRLQQLLTLEYTRTTESIHLVHKPLNTQKFNITQNVCTYNILLYHISTF